MDIDSVTKAAAASPMGPEQPGGSGQTDMDKNAFLQLLVTQLGNQDPLSPSDPTEFVSQLAQFTSLEQLTNVNEGIDVLALSQTAATSAQMVSFVGKRIRYDGDVFVLQQAGQPADLDFRLGGDAVSGKLEVRSADGTHVRTVDLGRMDAGKNQVPFDGLDDDGNPLPPGRYSFEVGAQDSDGEPVDVINSSQGTVTGVVFENGYPELVLDDGQSLTLGEVREVVATGEGAEVRGAATSEGGREGASDSDDTDNS